MRLLTSLSTKMLLTITLVGLIVGYIIISLNIKHQKEFLNTVYKSNTKFLHNTLNKVEENALRVESERHRKIITSLSVIFLRMQKAQYKKSDIQDVQDMLDLRLLSKGMIAIKILDSDNKIILMMYKKNGKIIHGLKEIPAFISNDVSLTKAKFAISDGKINGTLSGYFDKDALISEVLASSEIFLEDFDFFMEDLSELEQEVIKHRPIAFILFAIILAITTAIVIQVMVNSPLKKIKKGLDSFFSSLDNDHQDDIKKINISTKDIFEDMAKSLNSQISIGVHLHKTLEKTQKKVRDTVADSSIIQRSFIKNNALMYYFFDDLFIHWQPIGELGGDVYFFDQINDDECIVMCIDCTGHSIYGALITVLIKAIHSHVIKDIKNGFLKKDSPSQMLSYFNKEIKSILSQHDENSESDVGFDGGIICYNKKNQLITYSGARTPLLYINDKSDEINIIKSSEYSVGYKTCDADYEYEEYTIQTHTNMKFYIATDGFVDQIGGEKYFRFGKKRFYEMIKLNHNKSFTEQKDFYIEQLSAYQGNLDSIDDITFIGFKV